MCYGKYSPLYRGRVFTSLSHTCIKHVNSIDMINLVEVEVEEKEEGEATLGIRYLNHF